MFMNVKNQDLLGLPENHPDKITPKEESKSLVGRYVKALKDNGAGLKEGTLGIVKSESCNSLITEFEGNGTWTINIGFFFELIPEGFNPDSIAPKVVSKELTIDDLVEGEIYSFNKDNNSWIVAYKGRRGEKYLLVNGCISSSSYYRDENWGSANNVIFRLPTPQEKKHLNVCIKQDKFIPQDQLDLYDDVTFELKTVMKEEPKYDYEVVHCTTQEEYNEVRNNYYGFSKSSIDKYCYFRIKEKGQYLECYTEEGLKDFGSNIKIYSFQEWCTKFNHNPEFMNKKEEEWIPQVNDYIVVLENTTRDSKVFSNQCKKILKTGDGYVNVENSQTGLHDGKYHKREFRKALPHEIPTQQEEFVLPEKWCLLVTKENQEVCNDWREFDAEISVNHYMHNQHPDYSKRGISKAEIQKGYTEITFEQFKKYVLKENDSKPVESNTIQPKEMNKEELIEEAKRRFPIGTRYRWIGVEYVVENDTTNIYRPLLNGTEIDAGVCKGYFYSGGKWAEIISTSEECTPVPTTRTPDKQVRLSGINEETKIKIKFKQSIKI